VTKAKEIDMPTLTDKSPNLLMWIAGIAVILFSAAGIGAIMGWIPTSMGRAVDNAEPVTSGALPANTSSRVAAQTHTTAESRSAPQHVANSSPVRGTCAECGVIESTRAVTNKGEGSGIGAVGGAVVGGLIGNQVGAGRGNTVATAIGAVGGAVAGNEVEKRVKSSKGHEVTVRMEDGSSRVIDEANPSAWRTGDRVKVVSGVIQANP
jgi:outer membrane lipoprotein SlyB